jgi:hypothetical protein
MLLIFVCPRFSDGTNSNFRSILGSRSQSIAVIPYFMQKLHIGPEFVSFLTVDIVDKPHWKRTPERSGGKSCTRYAYPRLHLPRRPMPPLASCAATVRTQDGTQERARCLIHHPHYAERHLMGHSRSHRPIHRPTPLSDRLQRWDQSLETRQYRMSDGGRPPLSPRVSFLTTSVLTSSPLIQCPPHAGDSQWTTDVSAGVHRDDPARAPISHATHPVQRSSSTDPASLHGPWPFRQPAPSFAAARRRLPPAPAQSTHSRTLVPSTPASDASHIRVSRRDDTHHLEHASSSLYRGPDLTTFLRHTRSICLLRPPPLRTTTFCLACNAPLLRLAKR